MTGIDIHQALSAFAKGLRCTEVSLYAPDSWSFNFENELGLNVQCPWRIVNEHGIALGSEDDGQRFGLPEPVDGSKLAIQLLSDSCLSKLLWSKKLRTLHLSLNRVLSFRYSIIRWDMRDGVVVQNRDLK